MICPHCQGTGEFDPIARLQETVVRSKAFEAEYPRLYCPACHKRLSPSMDSVDAAADRPTVQIHCHHCLHHFEVPRVRTAPAAVVPGPHTGSTT